MFCGRDIGGRIHYPVLLRMMITTAQIAVAIIRVSALATINSLVRCTSVPTTTIIKGAVNQL